MTALSRLRTAGLAALMICGVALAPAQAQLPTGPSADERAVRAAWWEGFLAHGKLVALPDGRRMHLYCEGSGGPMVVLDAGLGDGAWSFASIQDQIARSRRVCAYDRAGYGTSSPGPMPRDSKALAEDLGAMLKASGEKGPYVVVGHSIASLDVREYALTHPKDVAGLVLIDPSYEGQTERMGAVAPSLAAAQAKADGAIKPCAQDPRPAAMEALCALIPPGSPPQAAAWLKSVRGPAYFQAMQGELASFEGPGAPDTLELTAARTARSAKLKGKPPLGEKPLVVLSAGSNAAPGMSAEETAAMRKVWLTMHDEIAALSSRGVNRVVEGTTHYIHQDKPQAVVEAVAEVAAAARSH